MTPRQQFREDRRRMQERALQRRENDMRAKAAFTLRERWTPEQQEEERKRLAADIARLIQSGGVTICPPSNPWGAP